MTELKESELKRNIGLRIIVQRQRMEMSQKELGLRIGVSGQQMQKYENGINGMPAYRLALCAKALDKPVGYIFPSINQFLIVLFGIIECLITFF